MRISSKGCYSLEAALYLATLPPKAKASVRTISESTGISDGYLEQLFIPLKKAGIIKGSRGVQGGYSLAKTADKITAGDILRIVEGDLYPVDCLSKKGKCVVEKVCSARKTWVEIYEAIENCVDSITLADIVESFNAIENPGFMI
ncbi:transcriptional regulator [Fibrobacterales bacterium]|nr:transcriptional regulator [Fibrobacterales bacterium]